jgi:hypothetical protein
MKETTPEQPDTSYRAYLDYCNELENSTRADQEVNYPSFDDWRDQVLAAAEPRTVFDGDNLKVLERFDPSETQKIIEKYERLGYGEVLADNYGDIVVYRAAGE